MDFDISRQLEQWDYQPGKIAVRKFHALDGTEKIQLRVDLGLLQMNSEGRPDGKRPYGHASLLEFFQAKLAKHTATDSETLFQLTPEDCSRLQMESLQYNHRYICLLELTDYAGVERDAQRNLAVFEFVTQHAGSEELAWSLLQFQPQLLLIRTRARALAVLTDEDPREGIAHIEQGIEALQSFFQTHSRPDLIPVSGELLSLENWLTELRANRPVSPRERLEQALSEAVQQEDYEKAAHMRDALRNLKPKN